MKITAIFGEPATGKTTLMRRFIEHIKLDAYDNHLEEIEPEKLVIAMHDADRNLFILGKYIDGETFAGTDRMSMAVQPNAEKFIKSLVQEEDAKVFFEGDRLCNQSFLEFLISLNVDLAIIYVNASDEILHQRHIDRGDTQSKKFLGGRETKCNRLLSNFEIMPYVTEFLNNTTSDQDKIIEFLKQRI